MLEIGGLLDPVGKLWGMAAGTILLTLVPSRVLKIHRWVLVMVSWVGLAFALIGTAYAANAGALNWTGVVPSALIYTVIFFALGRLGFAIGHRFLKKSESSGDDS